QTCALPIFGMSFYPKVMAAPSDFHLQTFFNHLQVFIKLPAQRGQPSLVYRVQVKLPGVLSVQSCSVWFAPPRLLIGESAFLCLVPELRAGGAFQKTPVNTSL